MNRLLSSMALSLPALLIATSMAFAEGDPSKGETIFALCASCHGPTASGMQVIGAPRTAGQNPWYLRRQIANFKAGIRGVNPQDTYGMQMPPIVATLRTQQDVEDVIAYLGTLKPEILPQTIEGGDVAKGKEIYRTCAACHGDDGKGIEVLSAPRLAGIPDWYLERQIGNFKKGVRGKHPDDIFGRQMAVIQELMLTSDQEVVDVLAYIYTLPKD
jgi:cytochrome c oxidase subunit 2